MRGEFLRGRPRPLPSTALFKRFLTRMLTRDLFAVANLVKYKNNYIVKTDVTFRSRPTWRVITAVGLHVYHCHFGKTTWTMRREFQMIHRRPRVEFLYRIRRTILISVSVRPSVQCWYSIKTVVRQASADYTGKISVKLQNAISS